MKKSLENLQDEYERFDISEKEYEEAIKACEEALVLLGHLEESSFI